MADRIDTRDKGRSSWMIFAIVAVAVIAVTAAFVWISERPDGETVGIQPAPTETDLSEEAIMEGTQQDPEVELSGENVRPEATDDFVTPTPPDADATPVEDDTAEEVTMEDQPDEAQDTEPSAEETDDN